MMAISVGVLGSTNQSRSLDFDAIPEGVSRVALLTTPTFVVRRGDNVKVFLTGVQHLAGEHVLWWCPCEHLFASPTHGELFDVEGQVVGGPARAGLDRLAARVVDGRLVVDRHRVIHGAARPVSFAAEVTPGPGPWDSGRSSFCDGAIRADSDGSERAACNKLDVIDHPNAVVRFEQGVFDAGVSAAVARMAKPLRTLDFRVAETQFAPDPAGQKGQLAAYVRFGSHAAGRDLIRFLANARRQKAVIEAKPGDCPLEPE
jgi:nitrite reductase/ring-hydroxylating ferredoxin subunit